MRDKEKIFEMLRSAVETPLEEAAVEDFIKKVDGDGLKIEQVDETHQKFNGIVYGKSQSKGGHYFKITLLHRAVWTYYYGDIPDGYDVHHIDLNKENNNISNLTIMRKSDHLRLHACLRQNPSVVPLMKKTFKCVVCGKEYEAFDIGQNRYCSPECANRYHHELYIETRQCQFCGKNFNAYKYNDDRFCSRECWFNYKSEQGHIDKICPSCGKTFSTLKSKNLTYCSPECAHKAFSRKETIECANCGKVFEAKPSSHRKYCSRECYNAARNHGSYNPKLATQANKTEIGAVKNRE